MVRGGETIPTPSTANKESVIESNSPFAAARRRKYDPLMSTTWPDHLPVWSDPERLGGLPCFRSTRVPVEALFENLEDGVSLEEFLEAFQGIRRDDAIAVLEYARGL